MTTNPSDPIWRLPRVIEEVGLSRSSIYRLAKEGSFPRQVKLGVWSSGWRSSEVERWKVERKRAGADSGAPGHDGATNPTH